MDEVDVDLRFAIIPEWIINADISDRAVRLYGVLDRIAGEKRKAWPSRETLATRLGCSRESVDRAVRELRTIEAIEVQHRRLGDGQPTSNLYVLRRAPSSPVTMVVVTGDDQGGRVGDDQVAAPVTTKRESLNESHGNDGHAASQRCDDTGFDEFWAIYPKRDSKKIGKAKTLTLWRKLCLDDRRAAWRGAKNYAIACEGGLTRAKDPERYVRGRVWEDWQTPAVADRPTTQDRSKTQNGYASIQRMLVDGDTQIALGQ